jgi:hypothetical protein
MQAAVDLRFGRRAGDSSAMRKIVVKRARYQPARLGHFQTRTKRAKRSARLLPGAKENPKRAWHAFGVFPNARPLRKTRRFPLRSHILVNIGVGVTAASLGRKLMPWGPGGIFSIPGPDLCGAPGPRKTELIVGVGLRWATAIAKRSLRRHSGLRAKPRVIDRLTPGSCNA